MGYMRHHAIVVSASYGDVLDKAYDQARDIGLTITPIVESPVNGVRTFLVAPDGSKEGWEDSHLGNKRRMDFIKWMDVQRYDDGSGPLSWAEIQYGDDDGKTLIASHSDERAHSKPGSLVS